MGSSSMRAGFLGALPPRRINISHFFLYTRAGVCWDEAMRRLCVIVAAFVALTSVATASDHPLGESKFTIKTSPPNKQSLFYRGIWNGSVADLPTFPTATLEVKGGPGEGGTGVISLDPTAWQKLRNAKGYKYVDPNAAAGGVKKIILKNATPTKPGKLRVVAGKKDSFVYQVLAQHTEVALELVVGGERWCAFAYDPETRNGKIKAKEIGAVPGCSIDTVVDVAWLQAHLGDPDVQVVDARATVSGGHIPGAIDGSRHQGPFWPKPPLQKPRELKG